MAKPRRRSRMSQIVSQVAEAIGYPEGWYATDVEVDGEDRTVWMRMPVLDQDELEVLQDELRAAASERDRALVLLSGRDDVSAEEQLDLVERAGLRPKDVTTVWMVEMRAAMERAGKSRSRI